MEDQLNGGSIDSQHTIIHKSPSFLEKRPSLASFTNIYITTTTIIGCTQQQKEQSQGGEGEDTEGHLDKLMNTRIGHMGWDFVGFLMWVFDCFDNAGSALLVIGIFTLALMGWAFF